MTEWPAARVLVVLAVLVGTVVGAPAAQGSPGTEGPAAQPRVVGGKPATITDRPFQVALWDPSVRDGPVGGASPYLGQFCGGSIIDARHVVTAAHCMRTDGGGVKSPASIRVLAGTAMLPAGGEVAAPGHVDVAVSSITTAPGYDAATADLDIAVLTLSSPLYTGSPAIDGRTTIAPIGLAGAAPAAGQPVRLSGWGDVNQEPLRGDPSPSYPQALQEATLTTVDTEVCRQGYARERLILGTRVICAGGGAPDACFGDSGGPLTHQPGGVPLLAGVVGSGYGCAQPGFPSIYANVADRAVGDYVRASVPAAAAGTPVPAPPAAASPAAGAAPPAVPGAGSVPAAPPGADRTRPVTKVVSRSCSRTRCAVNVKVADPVPSSGIRRLEAALRWSVRTACTRDGRRTRCVKPRSRRISPRSIGGGHYAVVATKLARRRTHTLTIVARDRAGNRQSRATVLRLRTR